MYRTTPHDADSRNTIDGKELKKSFVVPEPVNVHIPQTGDHELPGRIHDLCALRYANVGAWTKFCNAIPRDRYSHIGFGGCAATIDDRDMREDNRLELSALRGEIGGKNSEREQWY